MMSRKRTSDEGGLGAREAVTGEELVVVALRPQDHRWAARLHLSDLPHGFFPRLGERFVRRWHQAHVASPHAIALVALHEGVPVGFALGSTDRRAHVAWLLRHRRRSLALAGMGALVVRPRALAGFLRTRGVRYAKRLLARSSSTSTTGVPTPPVAVLEAIVVVSARRRRGVGSALVNGFLARAAAAGTERAELATFGESGAAGFYERRQWSPAGRHVNRDGREVLTFSTSTRDVAA